MSRVTERYQRLRMQAPALDSLVTAWIVLDSDTAALSGSDAELVAVFRELQGAIAAERAANDAAWAEKQERWAAEDAAKKAAEQSTD